jgi:cysteinyl-tRNA synthetase
MSNDDRESFNQVLERFKTRIPSYGQRALRTELKLVLDYLEKTKSSRAPAEQKKIEELAELLVEINKSDDPDKVDKLRDKALEILGVLLQDTQQ